MTVDPGPNTVYGPAVARGLIGGKTNVRVGDDVYESDIVDARVEDGKLILTIETPYGTPLDNYYPM